MLLFFLEDRKRWKQIHGLGLGIGTRDYDKHWETLTILFFWGEGTHFSIVDWPANALLNFTNP
jgi:hypothetical protein